MAAYTEELLGPWRRRLEEQAEEIGTLRAELRQAQATAKEVLRAAEERVAEYEAVTDEWDRAQEAEAAAARRPWWRFW